MQTNNELSSLIIGVTDTYKALVYSILSNGIRDTHTTEDLYSKVCERIFLTENKGMYTSEGKEKAYICTVARNIQMDYFRKQRRVGSNTLHINEDGDVILKTDTMADATPNVYDKMKQIDEIKWLHKHVEYLSPDIAESIKMRFFREMSFKEIAEEQNVSINTALGRVRYGIRNLRNMKNN